MKILCERCGALAEGRLEARPGGATALACGACGAEVALGDGAPSASASPTSVSPPPAATPAPAASPTPSPASAPEVPSPTEVAPPASTPAPPPAADDEAWAAVVARWDDEAGHRAFLARFRELEGLAAAGRRYREVLSQRPGDPVALRWRDEILRRATAQGLTRLPRASPPRASPKLVRWAVLAGMIGAGALAAAWMAWRLLGLARG